MKKKGNKEIKAEQLRISAELLEVQHLMPIESADYDNLKDDITANGIRDPLKAYYKDKNYYVIAGMNRLKIAKQAGLKTLPVDIYEGTPAEYRELAYKDNLNRRHLNTAQKRKLAEYFIKQDPGSSARAIAEKSGLTDKTAGRIKADLQRRAEIPHLPEVKGSDGKKYKAEIKPEKVAAVKPEEPIVRNRTPVQSIITDLDLMISRIKGMKTEFIDYDIDTKMRLKLLDESFKTLTAVYQEIKNIPAGQGETVKNTSQKQSKSKTLTIEEYANLHQLKRRLSEKMMEQEKVIIKTQKSTKGRTQADAKIEAYLEIINIINKIVY